MTLPVSRTLPGLAQHLLHSRPIAVHRNLLAIAGSPCAGILLSQLVYWTRRGSEIVQREGWIFKTAEQWERETGMSWKVQRRARKYLIEERLLEERFIGIPRRLEFRLNLHELTRRTSEFIQLQIDQDYLSLDLFRSDDVIIKQLLGHVVAYHRVLAQLTPHINDALFLSRLLHDQKQITRWQVRTRSDWLRELVMSRYEWETARRHLRNLGLLIERQGNYPRRVDMMVDQARLVTLLNKLSAGQYSRDSGKARARRDWAKLDESSKNQANPALGDIGRCSDVNSPAPESPDPAQPKPTHPNPANPIATAKTSPRAPQSIAQSRQYLNSEVLHSPLQQPAQPVVVVVATGERQSNSSGMPGEELRDFAMGSIADKVARPGPLATQHHPIQPTAGQKQPYAGLTEFVQEDLIWPKFIDAGHRPNIWTHLSKHSPDRAQVILDEVDWVNQRSAVSNPTGLVRHLCSLEHAGSFIAEGASIVQNSRNLAGVERANSPWPTPHPASTNQSFVSDADAAVMRARLRQQAQDLRKRTFAAPTSHGGTR